MAVLDPETGSLRLQIVYDGAPFSGKTSSILALGRILNAPVVTPGEDEGRTVYFDWMDYAGGLCQGHPIQCRVIGVPGQEEWKPRRQMILASADAVIFVADTSSSACLDQSLESFADLQASLSRRSREIPVMIQLNKRDSQDSLPVELVLEKLGIELPHIESIATSGLGVREAFVLTVGASVRVLRETNALYEPRIFDTQEMQLPNPEQLMEWLEQV